jgi:DMSO/TMAO reductase YedYZ heme-binding membrane subunit
MTAATITQSKEMWYLMRGSGLVALVLLTLTLVGGIVNVRRFATPRWPRAVMALLHRNIALLSAVFLAVHVATAALDSYVPVGWVAAVIPFASRWDRLWVALGTAAVDLMIALVVTSLLRSRIKHRTWRAVHWVAYAAWPLAMVHGFTAGTDSGRSWAQAVYVGALIAVAAAVAWRLRGRSVPTAAAQPSPWRSRSVPTAAAQPSPWRSRSVRTAAAQPSPWRGRSVSTAAAQPSPWRGRSVSTAAAQPSPWRGSSVSTATAQPSPWRGSSVPTPAAQPSPFSAVPARAPVATGGRP